MFRKFILVALLCVNSYKTLAEDKKLEDIPNKNLINISKNYSYSESSVKKKKQSTEKKKLKGALPSDQIQIKGIKDNFEIIDKTSDDDIHTAKERKLVQNNFEIIERISGDDIHTARRRKLVQGYTNSITYHQWVLKRKQF
ncbi:hypothetical protein [Rickettsia endosymbiont of Urophora cardui]|uniref:hypothetical protein n=1 Tax=Rickettsia endosymbiont of Urophora cardui TaxID=3066265 RepID=UPI00313ABF54